MRILLSSENFDAFGGMETYTQTVAQELMRLGHQAAIFTPRGGTMAELTRRQAIPVLDREKLPDSCDAVVAQDAATSHELKARYPEAVRVLVAHSRDHVLHEVPQLPEVCHGVVVLNDRVGRWVQARAWHPQLTRLRQPIALSRYSDLEPPRPRPRRVLVMTNYVSGPRGQLIQEACREAGYEASWIGATTRPSASPERALAEADIVIGLGRSVLEAMAAGRAAYVYGVVGGGGWVTPESYSQLEADGFAGLTDGRPVTVARMASELRQWRPDMGEANRDLASVHHSARTHAVELVNLVRRLGEQRTPAPAGDSVAATMPLAAEELARLLRLEWQMYERAMKTVLEANDLRAERDRHEASAEDAIARVAALDRELQGANARVASLDEHLRQAEARVAELDTQLQGVLATRRYRLAVRVASPIDTLRARLKTRSP
ncbi:MAG TPA: hypothetical protein VES65_06120 [Solirubrobacteraceae bacterium]|nr:hypothetical protein [Solirubrobacteraceae bacterium]